MTTKNFGDELIPSKETEVGEVPEECAIRRVCPMMNGFDTQRLSKRDIRLLRSLIIFMLVFGIAVAGGLIFIMTYPFKTVVFTDPDNMVTNQDKKVPCNGVVTMRIPYIKYVDNPGLVIKTLVREKPNGELEPLDSTTVVTTRKKGSGVSDDTFTLNGNPYYVGKSNRVVFSIFYTLYKMRPVMVQYETEPFEITPSVKCEERK